jgi:RHS repeat-associated protein
MITLKVLDRKTKITATGGSSGSGFGGSVRDGSGSSTTITHYEGDVVFATDYYPFGSAMSRSTPDSSGGRMYSGVGYRYGFNGQEKEPELGDYYAFEYRIHDARLGRFLSVDPIGGNYPWQSVYAYFKNCPILIIDFLGLGEEPKSGNKVKEPNWWYAYVEDVDINQRNIAKASYKFHLWMFRMHLDKAERSEMQNIEDLPFGIYRSLRVDIFTKKINEKYCRKYWNYSKPGFQGQLVDLISGM